MNRTIRWPLIAVAGVVLLVVAFAVVRFGFGSDDADPGETGGAEEIRVAVVTAGVENDLSATQSLVGGLDAVSGISELAVTGDVTDPLSAAAAIRGYADEGYDLILAHGPDYGDALPEIAAEFPRTAFAWGPGTDTFGLDNVSSFNAAANEGGYVLGALAADMCSKIGLFGPTEIRDARLYLDAFELGARAGGADVDVVSVDASGGVDVAADTASILALNGADCLSGSGSKPVGAIGVAERGRLLWFGTEFDQSSAAVDGVVVAGQIYRWEVVLQDLVDDVRSGSLGGNIYGIDLDNGGLVVEFGNVEPTDEMTQLLSNVSAQVVDRDVVTIVDG